MKPGDDLSAMMPLVMRAIYLQGSQLGMAPEFDPLEPGQQLQAMNSVTPKGWRFMQQQTDGQADPATVAVAFAVEFGMVYLRVNADAPASEVAHIKAVFVVDYFANSQAPPMDDAQLKQWASSQAVLHAWSYWREYCHSSMMRMSLPVVMVPLMLVGMTPGMNDLQQRAAPAKKTRARRTKDKPSA